MRKIYLTITVLLSIATSCSNSELDIENPNQATTQQFWKTTSDAVQSVNAVYSTFHRGSLARWVHFLTIVRSDEAFSTSPAPWIRNYFDLFNYENYNDGLITGTWGDCYIGINRANQAIDNIPNIQMDEALKARLLAEAKMLRGTFYYTARTAFRKRACIVTCFQTNRLSFDNFAG